MPEDTPCSTVDSLATFRQQVDESHHDLVNMLTCYMTIVLNPLIELTNRRFDVINRQMNRIVEAIDLNDNTTAEDPTI